MRELYALVDDVLTESRADGVPRFVLAGLAWHIDIRTGVSRPGMARLMRYTGRSEKTVERALSCLVDELGEVTRIGHAGNGRAASYRVLAGLRSPTHMDDGLQQPVARHVARHFGGRSPSRLSTNRGREQEQKNNTSLNGSSSGGDLPGDALELFAQMRRRLAAEVGSEFIAHTMVDPLELVGRRGDVLEVLAPDHSELRIRRSYGPRLEAFARELSGRPLRVHVVTAAQLGVSA